ARRARRRSRLHGKETARRGLPSRARRRDRAHGVVSRSLRQPRDREMKRALTGAAGLFAISTAIWGSTWLAIKYQLGVVAPEVSVAYRFALAALLLALWCMFTGRSLRFPLREHAWLAMFGATLFGLNYVGVYWSEQYVTSGLVAVLFSTIVFMNPIGMRLAFGTPLSARTFVAATLGVVGVALLFLPELSQASHGGSAGYGG